jgi:hypothetical protein
LGPRELTASAVFRYATFHASPASMLCWSDSRQESTFPLKMSSSEMVSQQRLMISLLTCPTVETLRELYLNLKDLINRYHLTLTKWAARKPQ